MIISVLDIAFSDNYLSMLKLANRIALPLLIAALCLNNAPAEVTVYEKFLEYEVAPKTIEQLGPALNNASPVNRNGRVFHAHTDTHVSWRFWWDEAPDGCEIAKVSITLEINFDMPKLASGCCSDSIMKVWNQYYPALLKHEEGHAQIAIDTAEKIEEQLVAIPVHNNCRTLEINANTKARAILEKHRLRHQTYDLKTGHGRTEGADLRLYLR